MNNFYKWTTRGFFYLFALAFLCGSINDIWSGYQEDNLPIARMIVALVIFSIAAWTIYGLVYIDKFTTINGKDKEKNKQIVYDLVKELFPDMKFFFNGDTLSGIRHSRKRTRKETIIKFEDSVVLISILTKMRFGDVDSPFHVLGNQADVREIKSKFLSRL